MIFRYFGYWIQNNDSLPSPHPFVQISISTEFVRQNDQHFVYSVVVFSLFAHFSCATHQFIKRLFSMHALICSNAISIYLINTYRITTIWCARFLFIWYDMSNVRAYYKQKTISPANVSYCNNRFNIHKMLQ